MVSHASTPLIRTGGCAAAEYLPSWADPAKRRLALAARYPNISDHGLIGDLQTAALVSTDGVLDWFCCPRFDSPSVFASLLDADRGGFYRIAPDRDDYVARQMYLPDTAVLVTRFMTPDGVGEVHDFMPVLQGAATDRQTSLCRIKQAWTAREGAGLRARHPAMFGGLGRTWTSS